jgi:hypothetical protein
VKERITLINVKDFSDISENIYNKITLIINEIVDSTSKYKIEYINNDVANFKSDISNLDVKSKEKGYVYLLFDETNKKCLYVGKSNDLKKRLKQHMESPVKSTSSKYSEVVKYVASGKSIIYFDFIKVNPPELYGAVEGQIISIIEETQYNDITRKNFWNSRHD